MVREIEYRLDFVTCLDEEIFSSMRIYWGCPGFLNTCVQVGFSRSMTVSLPLHARFGDLDALVDFAAVPVVDFRVFFCKIELSAVVDYV